MSSLNDFTVSNPRPLPVIVLADISGSMVQNGKIDALNSALAEMIVSLADEDDNRSQIQMAIITFGIEGAKLLIPLQAVSNIKWENMVADGKTPMGAAIDMAIDIIEDKNKIPSRAYRPTLVLVSDGLPTDDWERSFNRLNTSERASKTFRFAMGIGDDADLLMLNKYINQSGPEVFKASDARQIRKFFKFVTMSVSVRTKSINPNTFTPIKTTDIDNIDI